MGKNDLSTQTVELPATDGVAFVEQTSPLTRLHYFDGQFLRAASLTIEQEYHRQTARLANLAGGWGAVHGLGVSLAGDQLAVSAGLAITPAGSFVLASQEMKATLAELLKVAAPAPAPGHAKFADCPEPSKASAKATAGLAIYEITVGPIEGLCGNEAVYGKLCETACASDSRHPWWREGVVLRLRPVTLALPASSAVAASNVHLRNRVASAYFAAEPWLTRSLLSAAGLASDVWCEPAVLYNRDEVVIGLLAREGATVRVLDAWGGRRERMDTQARGYWQGRMAMRPWNVFLAQILQFQCQLAGLFDPDRPVILPGDDCNELREVLGKARKEIEGLLHRYGTSTRKLLLNIDARPTIKEYQSVASEVNASFADLDGLSTKLAGAGLGGGALPQQRMLLNAGFFELPPAGYLPVSLNADVQEQLRRMFGEGVTLHFHAVAADEIGHLVEQAQHMKRISLTRGLDDPKQREPVEIFVPDGEVSDAVAPGNGTWWRLRMLASAARALTLLMPTKVAETKPKPARSREAARDEKAKESAAAITTVKLLATELDGLLRSEGRQDGTYGFALAASSDTLQPDDSGNTIDTGANRLMVAGRLGMGIYLAADVSNDPFDLPVGGSTRLSVEICTMRGSAGQQSTIDGALTVLSQRALASGMQERLVQADIRLTEGETGQTPVSNATRFRLVLRRDGDARTGIFIIDDERQDPASPPVNFEWDDTPRRAVMYVEAADAGVAVLRRMQTLRTNIDISINTDSAEVQPAVEKAGRTTLLEISALPAMPTPDSAIGSAVMTTLSALSDATDDAAFLMRARRRLFPVLDAPKTQQVRARHDWVMFRRARTHLCGPACVATPSTATETFQVWHLKLESAKDVQRLAAALDKGDAKALALFNFRRVGLLRYRDESAFSEETAERVLAMWQAQQPAAQVALGRVWEIAPEAGQGWQNHMRLRNMLEQIRTLTQPPPRDGSIATVAPPPGTLGDKAYDGGMLVVTLPAAQDVTVTHRVIMLREGMFKEAVQALQQDPEAGWKFLQEMVQRNGAGLVDLSLQFLNGALPPDDLDKLKGGDRVMHDQIVPGSRAEMGFRVDAQTIAAEVHPLEQHTEILRLLGVASDLGAQTVPVANLGNGAQVLTLLGYHVP